MWSRWLKHISFDSCQTGRPSKHCQHVQNVCSVFKLCVFFSFCDIRVWGRSLKHISFDSCRTRRPLKHSQHVQTVCSVFKLCLFLILWHRGVKSIADRQVYAGFVWKLLSTCVLSCLVVHVVYSFSKTLHKFLKVFATPAWMRRPLTAVGSQQGGLNFSVCGAQLWRPLKYALDRLEGTEGFLCFFVQGVKAAQVTASKSKILFLKPNCNLHQL